MTLKVLKYATQRRIFQSFSLLPFSRLPPIYILFGRSTRTSWQIGCTLPINSYSENVEKMYFLFQYFLVCEITPFPAKFLWHLKTDGDSPAIHGRNACPKIQQSRRFTSYELTVSHMLKVERSWWTQIVSKLLSDSSFLYVSSKLNQFHSTWSLMEGLEKIQGKYFLMIEQALFW